MASLTFAKDRLRAFLAEAQYSAQVEFPYPASKAAVETIEQLFKAKLARLDGFNDNSDPSIIRQECKLIPSPAFPVRSPAWLYPTFDENVPNAVFELCGPLLRLAKQVLEHEVDAAKRTTRLLLSSEWEYSPFVYRDIPDLPGLVLIGLPAARNHPTRSSCRLQGTNSGHAGLVPAKAWNGVQAHHKTASIERDPPKVG